jgi:hypothetical protein
VGGVVIEASRVGYWGVAARCVRDSVAWRDAVGVVGGVPGDRRAAALRGGGEVRESRARVSTFVRKNGNVTRTWSHEGRISNRVSFTFSGAVRLAFVMILRDFLLVGLVTATLLR